MYSAYTMEGTISNSRFVAITFSITNCPTFAVYFRVTSTAIKHHCNETPECKCCTQ